MKYKIIVNNVEVSAEQIKEIIKNNPELLEESKGGRYFLPKEGDYFFYISEFPNVQKGKYFDGLDRERVSVGVYRTREEAELARDKQKAIVACWKWAQENAPFEPDWGDAEQEKYFAIFGYYDDLAIAKIALGYKLQFTLPYFKSLEDFTAFRAANKEHLELLFKR